MFVLFAARPTPAVPPPDGPSPEYTVASGEVVPARAAGGLALPGRFDPLRSVPEKLALVMVGGLLLGLAAAVRRTT